MSFQNAIHDNLTIESEGQSSQVFTGTNYILPIILPLFCSPVYLRFTTDDSTIAPGFQIVYREHPSSNSALTQLPPLVKPESQISTSPANNTFFSVVLQQLDTLIADNLLTGNKLEYVQSQLNDRLEDFSYQLSSHVRTISNASCTFITSNSTAYTPPFPFYEYVMLSLLALSILFSIFFLFLTCCLSRQLYHFYLVSNRNQLKTDSQKLPIYRPGKYTHALQYALIPPLMSPACAKPLPPDNLLLELWNHAQWESDHDIFIPFLQYRPSEAFFEYTIFVFVISIFFMVFYLLLFSKSGGRSPSSNSSITRSTSTLRKRLSQASLITLLSCGSNAKASLVPITKGTFVPPSTTIPEKWHCTSNTTWEHVSFDHLWERPQDNHVWKNPIPMYSKIFGYAITEGKTFSEKYFPGSRYWDDVTEMERTCLCEQSIMDLHPSLSLNMLFINTPIVRSTGDKIRHRWK